MRHFLSVLLVLASTAGLFSEAQAGVKETLRFAKGKSYGIAENTVIRGERDYYFITARAGQTMAVTVSSEEENAVFDVYAPGARIVMDDGMETIEGEALDNAVEQQDWQGELPNSGRYTLVVGGTRGNASYRLRVGIE